MEKTEKPERKKGPRIQIIDQVTMPEISFYHLDNGIPVYEINSGTQDVLKLEFIHIGGRINEEKWLTSRASVHMMKESSERFTQSELAEFIDFYGSSLTSNHSMDHTSITLYTLGKYMKKTIPVLADVIFNPVFTEKELQQYTERNINNLSIDLQKNDILAYREFTDRIFGRDHVYGYNSTPEMYASLNLEDVKNFYNNYMGTTNAVLVIGGKITEEVRTCVNENLGKIRRQVLSGRYVDCKVPIERKAFSIKGKGDYQNAIIIGRRLFTKSHKDYPHMVVLNTLFGGYFGSRLMKSLREDLGYTYEVSCQLDMMKYDGFMYVSTDVDPSNSQDTIRVIYEEMERLSKDTISEEERKMVINYLMGNIMNMLDGPFRVSNWVVSLITSNLSLLQGHQILKAMHLIDKDQLKNMAKKYYDRSSMMELVVK